MHSDQSDLSEELYWALETIINLMPDNVQVVLNSYSACKTRQDTYQWRHNIVDALIEVAEVLPPDKGSYWSDRAYCPLCKQGSTAPYDLGFTVPEGLRRHLTGWSGHVYKCSVMRAAERLARIYWNSKFAASEAEARDQERIRTEERRKTEQLYRVEPAGEPLLIDESIYGRGRARTDEELLWAEQRLNELGFHVSIEGSVKSYIRDHGDVVVFADPRQNGELWFCVFKKPLPRKMLGAPRRHAFALRDSWKNKLPEKYDRLLAQVVARV